jgi:hypothetical protein
MLGFITHPELLSSSHALYLYRFWCGHLWYWAWRRYIFTNNFALDYQCYGNPDDSYSHYFEFNVGPSSSSNKYYQFTIKFPYCTWSDTQPNCIHISTKYFEYVGPRNECAIVATINSHTSSKC